MKNIISLVLLGMLVCLFVLFFSSQPQLLLVLLLAASAVLFLLDRRDWKLFSWAVIFAVIFEPLAVKFGAWGYPTGDMLGVPFWIFLMWGIMATIAHRLGSYFIKS